MKTQIRHYYAPKVGFLLCRDSAYQCNIQPANHQQVRFTRFGIRMGVSMATRSVCWRR